jgi:hypothetical protein
MKPGETEAVTGDNVRHPGIREREPSVHEHAPKQEPEGDCADQRDDRPAQSPPSHVSA